MKIFLEQKGILPEVRAVLLDLFVGLQFSHKPSQQFALQKILSPKHLAKTRRPSDGR